MSEIKEREQDYAAIQRTILAAAPDITYPIPYKTTDGGSTTDIAIFK